MALPAETITKLKLRWDETYLAQLTRRETYDPDDPTLSTVDEDVLEQGVLQAREYVAQRKGHAYADADQPAVIECAVYYMYPDGTAPDSVVAARSSAMESLVAPVAASLRKASTNTRSSYDGDTFISEENVTRSSRARRSWF